MTEQNCYGDGTVFEGVKSKDSSIQTWFVSVGFGRTTMTDKELIELAARAAGIEWRKDWLAYLNEEGLKWNPLGDDGDAFRLAVKLGLDVVFWVGFVTAEYEREMYKDDPYAATRRAIVRAAAEIGRTYD